MNRAKSQTLEESSHFSVETSSTKRTQPMSDPGGTHVNRAREKRFIPWTLHRMEPMLHWLSGVWRDV
jgi:hypothetical protein